ncbi:pyocin knob domain-containing protein [Pseudomonas aeruginosa]|nr:pyocin knob domain-containing protein [Pseudomonas aeruginosa]
MPWYSTGTVSVVLNSDTVTGSGTAFSANARAGDAFRGPDGRWYEIGNVASATVLTIKPAYQGASATAQAYSITPVQGYPKALADQFRDLNNQWGSLLAAVKPWAIASTGSQAQVDMGITEVGRALNGASTAANALRYLGGVTSQMAFTRSYADSNALPNECGFFGIGLGPWSNLPPGIDALNPIGSAIYQNVYDASTSYQLFIPRTSNILYFRRKVAGNWQAWVRMLSDAQLLGTVAQSSGAPIGAIMERGSNANGQYERFANGTQVCTVSLLGANDRVAGQGYTLTLPATFTGDWAVGVSVSWASHSFNPAANNGIRVAYANGNALTFILSENLGTNRLIFSCVGRWF